MNNTRIDFHGVRTEERVGAAWSNWAGNQRATPVEVFSPSSVDDIIGLVRDSAVSGRRLKAVGSGHSFTDIAYADDRQLELSRLAGSISVDRDRRLVTIPAGLTLYALNDLLAAHDLALPNLGDVDTQTVAGALATGTHGTGATHGCLSTFVAGITLVTGTGELLRCSAEEHPEVFAAARIGLGALGVIVELTLSCVDAFTLRADERPAALGDVLARLPALLTRHEHFEFFWFPYTNRVQVRTYDRVPADDAPLSRFRGWLDDEFLTNTVFGVACRLGRAVPALAPAINTVAARALTARTYTGRSDRVFCTPRRVRFVEMEYALPRAALPEALAELRGLIDRLPHRVLFPIEVRFTAPDDIWLSHSYQRESVYIAIHQYVGTPCQPYFRGFEKIAQRLDGRPHWGKIHYLDSASLRPAYPRFADFLAIRDQLDPYRVFANRYTDRVLGP